MLWNGIGIGTGGAREGESRMGGRGVVGGRAIEAGQPLAQDRGGMRP